MLGSKLDLFKLQWLDVVFADRNKSYGAYQLRKDNARTTNRAMLVGGTLFVLAICSPMIINLISGFIPETKEVEINKEVVLAQPPPVDPNTPPPPPPPEPPKPKTSVLKFPPPVVVPAAEVVEEPPTVEDLKVADPGQKNIEGDPNAEVRIDEPVGNAPKEAEVVEDNSPVDFASIANVPEYPGGQEAFGKEFQNKFKWPALALEQGVSGRIVVQFVVEKDGSLTDIKVLKDLGMGTGAETSRVLKLMKKWKPGVQNGKNVRVAFTLPIVMSVAQ